MKASSSETFRVAPSIPDHEMLRLIGKGSYGEVWLARSVTGAMRAVKVVQRSDFQYDKTFEREFEGIRKFEPISRSHPGLVDVLHVGRNLEQGFYYYVMELGDDQTRGSEIIPELYVARTLSSDINQREHGRLSVDECVVAGANLADGLHYLHQRGLTHRDVKPSNVIFVEGVAKLADIGLVAASGQRTFVGTEGFVPPEGPGSPAADIYSLGMVLYEVSTGNDRLEFPELPHRLPEESERPKWRALNAVICKACSQKPKDRFAEATDFAQALRRIESGRVRRKTLRGRLFRMMVWSGLVASLIMFARHRDDFEAMRESREIIAGMEARQVTPLAGVPDGGGAAVTEPEVTDPPIVPPATVATGRVKISSDPRVDIYTPEGEYIDRTDDSGVKTLEGIPIGPVSYILKREGFRDKPVSGELSADRPLVVIYGRLKVYRPPVDNQRWTNSFGMEFEWVDKRHAARLPVSANLFERFQERSGEALEFYPATVRFPSDPNLVGEQEAIYVTRDTAGRFCEWLTTTSRQAGYLTERHDYVLNEDADAQLVAADFLGVSEELVLLMCAVVQSEYVLATFTTKPEGAEIFNGKKRIGTGGEALKLETGLQSLTFKKSGYESFDLDLDVVLGEEIQREITLGVSRAAVLGRAWTNDLGMRFVPLGDELLIGEHEVRVVDFRRFTDESLTEWNHTPPFVQTDEHPVVKVKLKEAVAFCAWLTSVDLQSGMLEPGFEYRLPRDLEWSRAVGLPNELGPTPASRDGRVTKHYPWGSQWPPAEGVANLSDDHGIRGRDIIPGYSDGFANTAPVGSFVPNTFGIYDLSGNVWEWVEEPYGGAGDLKGVMRGGCFSNAKVSELESSCRNPVGLGVAGELNGFRVVVARSDAASEE